MLELSVTRYANLGGLGVYSKDYHTFFSVNQFDKSTVDIRGNSDSHGNSFNDSFFSHRTNPSFLIRSAALQSRSFPIPACEITERQVPIRDRSDYPYENSINFHSFATERRVESRRPELLQFSERQFFPGVTSRRVVGVSHSAVRSCEKPRKIKAETPRHFRGR